MPLSWQAHAGEIGVPIIREDKQSCSFVPARHSNAWGKQWFEQLCIDMLRIRVDIWIFFTYSLVFYGYLYTLVIFDAEASEPENVPNEIATPPLFHWLFAHIYWHCSPHANVEPEVTNHLFDLIISRVRPQIGRKWAQRWLWNYQDPIVGCCIQLHPSKICIYIYIYTL